MFEPDVRSWEFAYLVSTVIHEMRHSEQAFRAIQFALQTDQHIMDNSTPKEIIDAAKKAVKEHPLVPGTDEYKFAAQSFEYIHGEKRLYQANVYIDLENHDIKMKSVEKSVAKTGIEPSQDLLGWLFNSVKNYRQLPGESDSYLTEDKASRLWSNRNKPAPFNFGLRRTPREEGTKIPEPQKFIFPR